MFSINNIKKMFTKSRGKKTSSKLSNSDIKIISELNKILKNCTKKINHTINQLLEKKIVIKAIEELNKGLEDHLKKIPKKDIMKWDFYKICQILKDALEWCVSKNIFYEEKTTQEVINYIYTGLTEKDKNSFNNDIENLKKEENVTLNIKMNDSSMKDNVKKSLKNFLLSLMKFCFYSEVKEFTKEEIKNVESGNEVFSGGNGIVRKIKYTGKNNEDKVRAIKTIKPGCYKDWDDKSQGFDDDTISYIKGPKLVEDTFKEDRRKYKELKKQLSTENSEIADKGVKKEEVKNKFSNLAIQKLRKRGDEFVMISKLAEGDLSKFYYLGYSKDTNNKNYLKLDSKDKVNQLFNDLTSGIQQLHNAGLVHGDIKPENILVYRTKRGDLKYKITDFDSVVTIKNYKDNKIHTPGYVPECYNTKDGIPNGEEAKKVDCYAICKTLREVFDNTENFEGKNSKEIQDYAKKLVSKYEKINSCAFN